MPWTAWSRSRPDGGSEQREVLGTIQTLVNETAPTVVTGAGKFFIPWSPEVHGVTPSADGILLFGNAWLTAG